MMINSQPFWVVAVPNDDRQSLNHFRNKLNTSLAAAAASTSSTSLNCVKIHEMTQLVDEDDDMGDCFVVELYVEVPSTEGAEQDDPSEDVPTSSDILEWLFQDSRAEIWVEGQGSIPLAPPYGWKHETFRCNPSDADSIQQTLQTYGLVFVTPRHCHGKDEESTAETNNVPSAVYQDVKDRLGAHISILEETVRTNHPHIQLGESAFGFREYTHRGIERFEVLFDPSSALYQILSEGLEHQWITMVCRYLNRERYSLRLNISCVFSRPGATGQDWHTDGDHLAQDDDQPYALCIFVPLIPLTRETGFTRFWPKSHHYPNLLGLARAADALQATVDGVDLQVGDFILYDYTTWHMGVGNTSPLERPVLQFLYSADWYEERKNYGTKSVFDTS